MPKWILARTLTLVGILGAPFSSASAKLPEGSDFPTEKEAREYLQRNPTGPQATAAFMALSDFRAVEDNGGPTREQIVEGFSAFRVAEASSRRPTTLSSSASSSASSEGSSGGQY